MIPVIKVNLNVAGSKKFDPRLMCKELGIQPNQVWNIGERVGETIRLEETNGWSISTGRLEAYDVETVVRKILNNSAVALDALFASASRYEVEIEISVSVEFRGEMPSINLSRELISDIRIINASMDVDIN